MTLRDLIDRLAVLEIECREDDGRLRVSAPDGALTPEIVEALRAHKSALLEELRHSGTPRDLDVSPLSLAQERLWFLETMGGVGAAYNVAGAVRLKGSLDADVLSAAWTLVQQRQAQLRVRIVETGSGPGQVATDELVPLGREDWRADEAAALDALRAAAQAPFELSGALVRVTLHCIDDRHHILAVVIHHLISDGESLGILIRELTDAYASLLEGKQPGWAPLRRGYGAFARSQRSSSARDRFDRDVAYWRESLDDAPDAITLPTDRPRPAVSTFVGGAVPVPMPAALATRVREFARAHGATPFMVLLSAYAHLLMRMAGQRDVVIGVPVSNRPQEADALIGLFVNALPIRVQVEPSARAADLVGQVKAKVLESLAHSAVPWEYVLDALQPRRDLSRSPVFQVSFTFQDDPVAHFDIAGLVVTDVPTPVNAAKFELSLELQPAADGRIVGLLEFNTDLFDQASAERFVSRYLHVVECLIADADRRIADVDLLLPGEMEMLERAWQGPRVPFDVDGSVGDAFQRIVARQPDHIAVIERGTSWTFRELNQRAVAVGESLVAAGVSTGDRVGVVVDRTPATIANLFGVLLSGAAYVPIDPSWSEDRRAAVIAAARCKSAIDPGFRPQASAPLPVVDEHSDAYVLFTSGSTGTPKGVVVAHRSLRHLIEALEFSVYEPLGIRSNARVSVNGALTFDTSIKQVFQLLQGRTLVLVPEKVRLDGAALLSYATDMGVEVLDATPSQLTWLADAGLAETPGPIRAVLAGGEALTSALWERLNRQGGPALVNLYGPTECTVDATAHVLQRSDATPLLGRPLPNIDVLVLDDDLRPVPVGMPGEIVIGGPGVARGYVGDIEATERAFVPSRWPFISSDRVYRTGDRGRVTMDGRLEFLGRRDDQVKIRGHRVELGEIEAGLLRHEAARGASALVLEGERLVAAVAVDPLRAASVDGRERYTLANGLSVAQLNPNETDFLFEEMFERNAYLRHGVHLSDGAVVVDVGSNIGMFALFAHVGYDQLRFVCVEPNPHVRALLEANLRTFGADATVYDCGIGAAEGSANFTFYPGFSILSGLHADIADEKAVVRSYIRRQQEAVAGDEAAVEEVLAAKLRPVTMPVRLRPLGSVIDECGLTRIDLLKINVEKAELEVLLGLADRHWTMIRQVAFELHDVDGRLAKALALLERQGFEVAVDRDWSLEDDSGTNYYLYAVRPGAGQPAAALNTGRLARFVAPLVTDDMMCEHARAALPDYMVPEVCRVVDRLPLTSHGKVDRRKLATWNWTRSGRDVTEPSRPLSDIEQRLSALWTDVLGLTDVGATTHFFNSGGHSLSAARLAARIRDAFGVPFAVSVVFDVPTLAGMAAHISSVTSGAAGRSLQPTLVRHGTEGALPLSHAQERLLFLEQLEGGGSAYVIGGAMTLSGSLDLTALERALDDVVDRHPVLRSVFAIEAGVPVARLLDERVRLTLTDWTDRTLTIESDAVATWVREHMAGGFNLAQDLPLRAAVLRLSADRHVLAIACHHLVSDGWSVALFLRDLSARYAHRTGLAERPLVPLPIGYYDYARWQRSWLDSERAAADVEYWRTTLVGAAPALELPTDRPRPSITSYAGTSLEWTIPAELRSRIDSCARRINATPYTILFSAFAALLHRWSGQFDIVIGSPVAGRTVSGTDDVVGLFVNTLVMRLDLEGVGTFSDLLTKAREVTRAALDRQDVPFEHVVEAVRPPRRLDRHPIFQVMFALQNLPPVSLDLPGIRWSPLPVESTTARFDLSLVIDEVAEGYRATFEYATALFDKTTIERLVPQYLALLDTIVSAESTPIATVRLMTDRDVADVRRWNATDRDFGPYVPVHRIVSAQVERTPDAIALTYRGTAMTYREMRDRSLAVAAEIRRRGIAPGSTIAYFTDRSSAWLVSLLGIVETGCIFLPIDPEFPAERVQWMLEDSAASLVLSQRVVWSRLANTAAVITPVAFLDDLTPSPEDGTFESHWPQPDDPAYVIYTSGSTGRPKGAVNAHRGFTNLVRNFVEYFDTSATSQSLHFSSISFDSSLCEAFMALAIGGTVVLAERDEILPGEPLQRVLRERFVTHATIPPSALGGMVDPNLPKFEALISAGEACTPEVVQRWGGGRRFYNAYGPTESSVCSIVRRCTPGEFRVPIGRPLRNVRAFVVDAARQLVPAGMPGELAIGGVGVALGYWRRPELTAERFVSLDPYGTGEFERVYLTGDQVRYLPDGDIEFLGRKDTQIKLRGYRIELGEIEGAFRAHPGVRDCAVVVQQPDGGQKRLVAFVVSEGEPVPVKALKDHLRTRLPEYMVPPIVVHLDRMPQTTAGKRHTKELERWDVSGALSGSDSTEAESVSPSAQSVASIFAEVLDRPSFGPNEDFFEQGGHSLLAARVIGRIRERLGVELTLRTLFEAPTPVRLAERADAARSAGWSAVTHAQDQHDRCRVSPAQQRLWFIDQLNPSEAYTIVGAVRIRGPLDIGRFSRAVSALADRHEVLRSRYPADAGQPRMEIDVEGPTLRIADSTPEEVDGRARDDARVPFDLSTGPLFRPVLYRVASTDFLFVASMHHIVSDGWSIGVLVRDLMEAYREDATLVPGVQYGDYSRWWTEQFEGDNAARLESQLTYWRTRLGGAATRLDLPTDFTRPPAQTSSGGSVRFAIDQRLRGQLDAVATSGKASLFATLMSAYMGWLARFTSQSSFIVGTPVANRRDPALEGAVGLFANTLPVRADVDRGESFNDLFRRTARGLVDDLSHPDVPFDLIVQAMQPERDLSRSPLFQVMFAMTSNLVPALTIDDLVIEPETIDVPAAKFDLTLFIDEGAAGGGLDAVLEYNADLFTPATAERMAASFTHFLGNLVERPDVPVGDLGVLPDRDLALLESWNGAGAEPSVDYLSAMAIDRFESAADRTPDAPAVVWSGGEWTYRQLDDRANQLARALVARGVRNDTIVAVCLERSPELIVALMAVWKAGGAYVPIDPHYPSERIAFMLQDSRAGVVVTTSVNAERLDALPGAGRITIALDTDATALARLSTMRLGKVTEPAQVAYVMYTSGSTGTPKGVVIEHRGLANYLSWATRAYDMTAGAGAPVAGSIGFDATITSVFGPLTIGQRILLVPEGHEIDALADRAASGADHTLWKITPSHLDAVNAQLGDADFTGTVRHLVIGGEALNAATVAPWKRRAPGTWVTNEYGPTETVVGCAVYSRRAGDIREGIVPIGRPIANTELLLLDDRRQPVALGAVGEIFIAGDGVARGYHARPELTAERFVDVPVRRADGSTDVRRCYRTGDLARWNADGELEFLGRADTQIKRRGHRIELGEIESTALRDAAIAQAAAVFDADRLVLFVVPAAAASVNVPALDQQLRDALPAVMVPSDIVISADLPLTPNGKLDRAALVERARDISRRVGTAVLPADGFAAIVASEWTRLLGAAPHSFDDDFFAVGGHSLLAAQLAARLRSATGVPLSVRAIFDNPTWRGLTQAVKDGRRTKDRGTRGGTLDPRTQALGTLDPGPSDPGPLVPGPQASVPVLSLGQQRLWSLAQFDDVGAAYHIPAAFTLRGSLDVGALSAAWDDIVSRHDVLRMYFPTVDGRPSLCFVEHPPSIDIRDLRLLSEADAEQLVIDELRRPFFLGAGPLVRALLAQLDDDRWIFGVVSHHAISDGWSAGVMVRDLERAYRRRTGEIDATPEPLAFRYSDWAAWQRATLDGPARDSLAAYWKQALEGAPRVLDIPLDHPRSARQRYEGAVATRQVSRAVVDRVEAMAHERHATVYMTLLAAFGAVLSNWSRQEDVVVGTTVANREQPGTEDLIGFFVNTLPIRLRIGAAEDVAALVDATRDTVLNALDHQALPFEQLVEVVSADRNPAVTPIFQALFTYQQGRPAAPSLPGVEAIPVVLPHASSKFDLTLAADESPDGLDLSLEYRSDLFDPATMDGVLERFEAVLMAMAENPKQFVRDLPYATGRDLGQLAAWNETGRDYQEPRLIHQLIEAEALARPDAIALTFERDSLTYGDLNRHADALASRLRECGVGPDVLVGICLERSFDLFVAVLGILEAGGAYVPLDPEYPAQRLAGMIEDADLRLIVTTDTIAASGVLPDLAGIVLVSPSGEIRSNGEHLRTSASPHLPTSESLAYCIFTSGSTGRPKGAGVPHGAIRNRLLWMQEFAPLDKDDVVMHKTPVSFDVSVWELFWPLMFGARIAIAKPGGHRDAAYLANLMREERVTTVHFVPSMLQAFLEEPSSSALPSLRRVFASGEVLSWETARRLTDRVGCALHNLYGPTEAAVDVTWWTWQPSDSADVVPIGRPIANTQIHILDEQGRRTAIGVPGELCIGGVNLARGYVNRPELTAERFVDNPFRSEPGESARLYRTGDLARWRSDGQIEYLGRLDAQVKLRGFRIELGEIETVLRQHSSVADAAVAIHGSRLVAYVVPSNREAIDADVLRAHAVLKLPEYMVPSLFVPISSLPLSPSGKLDRRLLPEPPAAPVAVATEQPTTDRERALAGIWAGVLGLETVGATQNFFDLGGDSLRAIQVAARAQKAGMQVTPALMLQHQTVRALAAAAGTEPTLARTTAAEQGRLSGPVPVAPIVRWFSDLGFAEPSHFNQAVVLETPQGLEPHVLERALHAVSDHHDALRLRTAFSTRPSVWYAAVDDPSGFTHVDRRDFPRNLRSAEIVAIASRLQTEVDPANGPLWRAAYVTFGPEEPGRLIWVIHHLGVDGVSWGLLVDDLAAACRDSSSLSMATKTTSWRQWIDGWIREAQSGALESERAFWRRQSPEGLVAAPRLPHADAVSRRDSIRVPEGGARLTQVDIVAALWAAWREAIGDASMALDVESHGRVPADPSQDIDRTVGWFTAVYPLVFRPLMESGSDDYVHAARRTLDAVPRSGVGFGALKYLAEDPEIAAMPRPQVLFNFLGRTDVIVSSRDGFAVAPEDSGLSSSPRNRSPYALEVVTSIAAGCLEVHWHSPAGGLGSAMVERLSRAIADVLSARSFEESTGGWSPLVRLGEGAASDDGVPLFLVHPAGGTVMCYALLASRLEVPVYGLHAPGLAEGQRPFDAVGPLAARYVQAIVAAHPNGPYRLGGWSYGGIVAFEIARQLRAQGRSVEPLVIFDTLAPGSMPESEWQKDSATLLGDIFGGDAGVDPAALRGLDLDAQLREVTVRAVATGVLPDTYGEKDARRAWAVFQAHRHAERTYDAAPIDVEALVFSSDLRRGDDDPTLGWGRWLSRVNVVDVPGNHQDLLRAPVVSRVAEVIASTALAARR